MLFVLIVSGGKEQMGPSDFRLVQDNTKKWQKSRDFRRIQGLGLVGNSLGEATHASGVEGAFTQTREH